MRILLASTSSGSRGGGELCLRYLGSGLARAGHEVILWASNHPRMDEMAAAFAPFGRVVRAPYLNTYDHPLRVLHVFFSGARARRIAAQWRALSPDVVHVNKQNLEDGLDLLAAAGLTGLPAVSMIHITQTARFLKARAAGLRDWAAIGRLRRFPGCFVTTPASRARQLRELLGPSPPVVNLLNGVPLPALDHLAAQRPVQREQLGLSPDEFLVLGVGRMAAQKRPLLFLDLAEALSRSLPRARFLWVGDGVMSGAWDARVQERGLAKTVRRLAWQPDVQPFLAAADLFLHTAEYEGLPFAVLEALAAGKPAAISAELAAELDVFTPKNTCLFRGAGDLAQLVGDPARLAALAAAGRAFAESDLSMDAMAARYLDLYGRLRGAPGRSIPPLPA